MSTFQEFKHKELFHWICNSFYVHASPSSGQKFPPWHQGSHLILFDPPCSVNYSSHPGYVLGAGVCHRSCKQQAVWKLTKENMGLDWKHDTNQADQNSSAYTSRIACPIQNFPQLTRAILWTKKVSAPLLQNFLSWSHHVIYYCSDVVFRLFGVSFFRTHSFAFSTYRVRVVIYI